MDHVVAWEVGASLGAAMLSKRAKHGGDPLRALWPRRSLYPRPARIGFGVLAQKECRCPGRMPCRADQGLREALELGRIRMRERLFESLAETRCRRAQGVAQRGNLRRVERPLNAVERDKKPQQGRTEPPRRCKKPRIALGISIVGHRQTLPQIAGATLIEHSRRWLLGWAGVCSAAIRRRSTHIGRGQGFERIGKESR